MKKSSGVLSARLKRDRIELIEEIAREEKVDKSTVLDRALERYAKDWKLQKAIESYREKRVTLGRAAEIADVSVWEMIDILGKGKIPAQYDIEDFEEDLRNLKNG